MMYWIGVVALLLATFAASYGALPQVPPERHQQPQSLFEKVFHFSSQVEVMSAGSMDAFWLGEGMDKRGLGVTNRWKYTSFDGTTHARMNGLEEHFANHIIYAMTSGRHGGGAPPRLIEEDHLADIAPY
jgi:hypothetical protein